MIVQAALFLAAGLVISVVGVTRVFVPEDLAFMHTTAEALRGPARGWSPLVAHDRASLGGMLVCSGLGFLLPALWGYRRGEPWLWWTLALAAVPRVPRHGRGASGGGLPRPEAPGPGRSSARP